MFLSPSGENDGETNHEPRLTFKIKLEVPPDRLMSVIPQAPTGDETASDSSDVEEAVRPPAQESLKHLKSVIDKKFTPETDEEIMKEYTSATYDTYFEHGADCTPNGFLDMIEYEKNSTYKQWWKAEDERKKARLAMDQAENETKKLAADRGWQLAASKAATFSAVRRRAEDRLTHHKRKARKLLSLHKRTVKAMEKSEKRKKREEDAQKRKDLRLAKQQEAVDKHRKAGRKRGVRAKG